MPTVPIVDQAAWPEQFPWPQPLRRHAHFT